MGYFMIWKIKENKMPLTCFIDFKTTLLYVAFHIQYRIELEIIYPMLTDQLISSLSNKSQILNN